MVQVTSKYALYNEEHSVAPISAYLDKELVDMIQAAHKASDVKFLKDFYTQIFTEVVNKAGLTRLDAEGKQVAWTYTPKTKETELERVKRELAEAQAKVADLETRVMAPPTPPAVMADEKGNLVKKEEVKA